MRTSLADRDDSPITLLGLIITVAAVFLLPLPPALAIVIAIFGFLLTMFEGQSIYRLMAGGLVGWSLFVMLLADTAMPDVSDLEEPIAVPSGYGFELDPDSTNLQHSYGSQPMSRKQAGSAVVDVVDHYVDALVPEWTVLSRDEESDVATVKLREGDSSRRISVFVAVVTPLDQRAMLDLRIQALYCTGDLPGLAPGEVTCMTAPITDIVRYPDGGPISPATEPSIGPLREPVPLPDYGFVVDTGMTSEEVHAYRSTTRMSVHEARVAQRSVMRYYRRALDDWTVVASDEWYLIVKEAIRRTDSRSRSFGGSGTREWVVSSWRFVRSLARRTTAAIGAPSEPESESHLQKRSKPVLVVGRTPWTQCRAHVTP